VCSLGASSMKGSLLFNSNRAFLRGTRGLTSTTDTAAAEKKKESFKGIKSFLLIAFQSRA